MLVRSVVCAARHRKFARDYVDSEELGLGHGRMRTELKITMIHDGAAAVRGSVV